MTNETVQAMENVLGHIGQELGVKAGDVPALLDRIAGLVAMERQRQHPMNVYLIDEDGESRCWIAGSMESALSEAWQAHIRERLDYYRENDVQVDTDSLNEERLDYERTVVKSCTFVAELANP